jgi:hypothetical protein
MNYYTMNYVKKKNSIFLITLQYTYKYIYSIFKQILYSGKLYVEIHLSATSTSHSFQAFALDDLSGRSEI